MEINGKKAVVIGGASGMGRASAKLLAARGASVVVLDREGSGGKEVAAGLNGGGGLFYPVDVTDFGRYRGRTAGRSRRSRRPARDCDYGRRWHRQADDVEIRSPRPRILPRCGGSQPVATFNISRLVASHMSRSGASSSILRLTKGIPDEYAAALTKDAAFPRRLGRPEEYAKLVLAIVDNPMLNGQCLRLDAGQRFAPK
jgi:NAD(P)-dependent dehydrogenase (short-subunit alcohol dehydrogenase family)